MGRFNLKLKALTAGVFLTLNMDSSAGVHLPVPYMSQPDHQTCLPTSFMMAVNYLGRIDSFTSDTVQDLHKYCQYNRFNAPDLARKYGLYALPNWHNLGWTRETVKHELDMGRPVVLGVNQGRSGHFILAVGYTDDDRVIVHDPSQAAWGFGAGGPNLVEEWENILWRGGIIIRPTPFPDPPPLSGVAVGRDGLPLEQTVNLRMTSGENAEVSFTLVNNGRQAWPDNLYLSPVDPESSPTRSLSSPIASGWISADKVTDALSSLEPQTTRVVTFKVTAPQVYETTTVLQYFNIVDGDGNWFGNHWLAGPGHRNMGVRMIVFPKGRPSVTLPLIDSGEEGRAGLPWKTRYGKVEILDDFSTAPPVPGVVARLFDPARKSDTAWLGDPEMRDYRIEAWVYCELKPAQGIRGYERVGIFARDNGQHAADTKNEVEIGHSLAMAFDTDDGTLRAGNIANGGIDDYRDKRHKLTDSGWYHFAITCQGDTITYELDGQPFHKEPNVRRYREGECGIFYSSNIDPALPPELQADGIIFSGLKVTEP